MSKTLTRPHREDKGDVDLSARIPVDRLRRGRFPSYSDAFCSFNRFSALLISATPRRPRFSRESEIPHAAAIMAIV